jgi:hypothetical protein
MEGKCNVLQYTGTDGLDKKHSLKKVCNYEEDPCEELVLSAYQEKIPARDAIYAHAQDFAASDELLL